MADDVFPAKPNITDVGIRDISIEIARLVTGEPPVVSYQAKFNIQVERSDGSIEVRRGNLIPHLTMAEITGLQNLMNRIRTKAQAVWGSG